MADITNPRVLAFVKDDIRPLAEEMRALKIRADATLVTWFAEISANCPNDASPVQDGREAEGVSRLIGSDVVNLITQLSAYQTACNAGGVAGVISKPCVRSVSVS